MLALPMAQDHPSSEFQKEHSHVAKLAHRCARQSRCTWSSSTIINDTEPSHSMSRLTQADALKKAYIHFERKKKKKNPKVLNLTSVRHPKRCSVSELGCLKISVHSDLGAEMPVQEMKSFSGNPQGRSPSFTKTHSWDLRLLQLMCPKLF